MIKEREMETSTNKTRVLFVCVHNSARSQMAEAFLGALAGDKFSASSAGLEPGHSTPWRSKS
jgi:arsenate reductase